MKDYFVLAIKNLKHRGIRSWLTLLGIFIGIVAVVSLISLGTGLKLAVGAQFGISATEVITIEAGGVSGYGAPGSGAINKLIKEDAEAISKIPSVELATGRIISTSKMEFNDRVEIIAAISIPDGDERDFVYDAMDIEPAYGRMLKDGDTNKILVGWNFYGDEDIFGKSIKIGNKIILDGEKFSIVGIMEKKGSFILDSSAYVNEMPLRDLTGEDEEVDIIVAKAKNKDIMNRAKEDIEELMRDRRDVDIGEEDFDVSTPEAMLETVNGILNGVQAFIIIVASISILIGILGIVNTMTTSVLERRKEIGIMKAIGARNSQVFLQFFIEAGMMGLVGGIAGVIVGSLIGVAGIIGINNFIGSDINMGVDFYLIGFTLLGSFMIGAIAGISPAMKAAKQNPVEALRG